MMHSTCGFECGLWSWIELCVLSALSSRFHGFMSTIAFSCRGKVKTVCQCRAAEKRMGLNLWCHVVLFISVVSISLVINSYAALNVNVRPNIYGRSTPIRRSFVRSSDDCKLMRGRAAMYCKHIFRGDGVKNPLCVNINGDHFTSLLFSSGCEAL